MGGKIMGIENEKKRGEREEEREKERERRRKLGEEIEVLLDRVETGLEFSDTCTVADLESIKEHLQHAFNYLPN